MTTRREFLQLGAGTLAGLAFVSCDLMAAAPARAQARRREVVVSGRRVKTVDVHAHCAVPEALALMNLKLGAPGTALPPLLHMATQASDRLRAMDEQGIDVEALSINPYWYKADRDLARQIIRVQNEKLAEACAAHPDRFVAFATVALQHPDLAAEQLEEGARKLGLRGAAIGGSVNGEEISDPRFHPFWAKAEQLGVLVFIHPQGAGAAADMPKRLKGNGYAGRSDRGCPTRPAACPGGTHGPIKRKPSEYLKAMYYDTMVFSGEGVRHLAAEVGAGQLMVGTDFPYPWTTTAVDDILEAPGVSDADKVAMLGGNAMKLLGIRA